MRKSKYSKEFKDSMVQLILNNNESVVKVAQDLDLNQRHYIIGLQHIKKHIIFQLEKLDIVLVMNH
jgi:transposase